MALQLALRNPFAGLPGRIKLPNAVPPFSNRIHKLFSAIWVTALLLAVLGPIAGLYDRYTRPIENSYLIMGSRVGIAVSTQDATKIRFPIGPETRAQGIRPGDDIVAIYGNPVPEVVRLTGKDLRGETDDPVVMSFLDLFYGSETFDAILTLRAPNGQQREVVIPAGNQHIDRAARELGVHPALLNYIDLPHILTYPFLLWAAWILHRRNSRDVVSSIVSLAILLTLGSEQPSASGLLWLGVPRGVQVFLYDLGNVCLLTGILLFPHGKLSPRLLVVLGMLPILMLLQGNAYRAVFMLFMVAAVLMLVRCLRNTPHGDLRQQIKWALYGFSSYALFLAASLTGDMLQSSVGAFTTQLILQVLSGFAMGIAFLLLQLGLLIALLRYRLYDAESVISRSASFAILTLGLAAVFAGVMEGIIESMQNIYGDSVGTGAAVAGAAVATMLIQPLHEKVQAWAEKRLHRNLIELRQGVPELVRDLREVADVGELLGEVLRRVDVGVRSLRSAVVMDREVMAVAGTSQAEVLRWLISFKPPESDDDLECNPEDPLFPLRVKLDCATTQLSVGWLLVGPRPDGSLPGGDEREALTEIAGPIARALRIVLKRERKEQEISELLDAFRSRIERLELMVAPRAT